MVDPVPILQRSPDSSFTVVLEGSLGTSNLAVLELVLTPELELVMTMVGCFNTECWALATCCCGCCVSCFTTTSGSSLAWETRGMRGGAEEEGEAGSTFTSLGLTMRPSVKSVSMSKKKIICLTRIQGTNDYVSSDK